MLKNAELTCFACNVNGTKCTVLTTDNCYKCRFFKTKEQFEEDRRKSQIRANEKGLGDYALIREREYKQHQLMHAKEKAKLKGEEK